MHKRENTVGGILAAPFFLTRADSVDRRVMQRPKPAKPQYGSTGQQSKFSVACFGGNNTERLDGWLAALVSEAGSDLLRVHGAPVSIRIQGEVVRLETKALDGDEIEAAVVPALAALAKQLYYGKGITDCSYRLPRFGRFRINLHKERGHAAAAIRALPTKIPSLSDLHLPSNVAPSQHGGTG